MRELRSSSTDGIASAAGGGTHLVLGQQGTEGKKSGLK